MTAGPPRTEKADAGYVPTYYPTSRSLDGALAVDVRPGENREDVDIRLLRDRTACISSVVLPEDGVTAGTPVSVALAEALASNMSLLASGELTLGDSLEICGVGDGSYRLFASATDADGNGFYGEVTFDVTRPEIELPPIRIQRPRQVAGKVTIEADDKSMPIPTGMQIHLQAKNRGNTPILTITRARVDASGDFVIASAIEGEYWLNIYGLPDGFYVT